MKKLFNVSDIKGISEKVAQSITSTQYVFKFEELSRDPNTLYRAGFYILTDSETGTGLGIYYVGRQRVKMSSRFSYGFYQTVKNFEKGSINSAGREIIRHATRARVDVHYVTMEDAKYLTNKLGKQGSLFAKFSKTETDIFNNMQEIKNQIKDNFKFKYQ